METLIYFSSLFSSDREIYQIARDSLWWDFKISVYKQQQKSVSKKKVNKIMDFLEFYLFYIISEKNVTNNHNKIKRKIQMKCLKNKNSHSNPDTGFSCC